MCIRDRNNKSTKTAAGWSQAKPVYLLSDKATIWAYYPYIYIGKNVASERCRSCGFDYIEPVGFALYIGQPIEKAE